ncbi:MAG: DUF4416 family protein [Firmicutes bacterium]|nr:DUF4416 family protein [Bacillota bacterium]
MGQAKAPEQVTPVASVFTADNAMFAVVESTLTDRLGPCIYQSERLPFAHTSYYEDEMGPDLTRIIFAFTKLLDPADLPSLKTWSNQLENAWSKNGSRRVNIDVGYVSLAKLVLASTKDHAHRLYLGQGIYGEVTLYYAGGEFQPWPWTYPDYASLTYRKIFGTIREQHRLKLRGQRK